MSLELNEILKIALKGGASDIHLKSGLPPMFRMDGALVPLKNAERLLPEELEKMAVGDHERGAEGALRDESRVRPRLRHRRASGASASTSSSSAAPSASSSA